MSTPADHGYVKCARCKCVRPHGEMVAGGPEPKDWRCIDVAWCSSQVPGVGLGRMDADTGRPVPRLPFSPDSEGTP